MDCQTLAFLFFCFARELPVECTTSKIYITPDFGGRKSSILHFFWPKMEKRDGTVPLSAFPSEVDFYFLLTPT